MYILFLYISVKIVCNATLGAWNSIFHVISRLAHAGVMAALRL